MAVKQLRLKTGIRNKVIIIICMATLIVMAFGIILAYIIGFNAIYETASDIHRKFSQLLTGQISQKFDREIAAFQFLSTEPIWSDAIEKRSDPAELSARLQEIISEDENIAAISIINKAGDIVASSDMAAGTHIPEAETMMDFSQVKADRIFVSDVKLDPSTKAWVVAISIPLKASSGDVAGLFMVKLSTTKFFSPLANFRIDLTGHASVIDGKGNIIYHPGVTPTNVRLCSDEDYRKLLTSKTRSAVIYDLNVHKKLIFDSFSEIASPVLLENGKIWRVLLEQDMKEVLQPLNKTAVWMALAIVFLLLIMAVIGFVFSAFLTRPIQALYAAAVEIMKGNWDYKIDVRTGDEIEQFADAFKEMIATIKNDQAELIKAKGELEVLSRSLESKVRARTTDLTMAKDKLNNYAKELERAIMVKSDFVAMASHELRTPLAAIKEGIGIVLEGKAGAISGQQTEFLDMAKRNVDRLGRLINDILDLQKLEQGKMAMSIRENDINETVEEVCEMMAHVAKEKGLSVDVSLDKSIPRINFDKDKIIQVLMNIVSNAVKFTQGGAIKVSTSKSDNMVRVSVADSGVGIKKEDIPQLFQKFSQLERGLERRPGGSGLGLTISKEIIEKHKGKIWVESKFGEGTTFYFTLPINERRARI